jgi:sugar phosphate isomerase/epimerase
MHERVSVNSLSFMSSPLTEVAGYLRELEPHRISFIGPHVEDPAAALRVIDGGGYRLETITHMLMSGRRLEADDATWVEPRESLSRAIGIAHSLGARSLYGLTGGHSTGTWEESAAIFKRAIAPCVEEAAQAGVLLMIENAPILYAENHIAHNLRDLVACAETAGIGVLVDIFGIWTESDLKAKLERAIPLCGLVQVSDYFPGDRCFPCRAVPGDGVIPLQRIIGWILEAGYTGAFDLELIGPRIDDEGRLEATRRAADNLSKMLHDLGA